MLHSLVEILPSHADTRAGRGKSQAVKVLIGAAAVFCALQLGGPGGFALGASVAATALVLPMPRHRKRMAMVKLERAQKPREVVRVQPAEVEFDGAKVIVRLGGRVWRSARLDNHEHLIESSVNRGDEGAVVLGNSETISVVHRNRSAAKQIDFAMGDGSAREGAAKDVVYLDRAEFARVAEALLRYGRGFGVAPDGPTRG